MRTVQSALLRVRTDGTCSALDVLSTAVTCTCKDGDWCCVYKAARYGFSMGFSLGECEAKTWYLVHA